jgi:hypothetical protein
MKPTIQKAQGKELAAPKFENKLNLGIEMIVSVV